MGLHLYQNDDWRWWWNMDNIHCPSMMESSCENVHCYRVVEAEWSAYLALTWGNFASLKECENPEFAPKQHTI